MLSLCGLDTCLSPTDTASGEDDLPLEDQIKAAQSSDPLAQAIRSALQAGAQKLDPFLPEELKQVHLVLSLSDCADVRGTLCISDRLYVPESLRLKVIKSCHGSIYQTNLSDHVGRPGRSSATA